MSGSDFPGPTVLIALRHLTVAQSLGRVVSAVGGGQVAAEVDNAGDALRLCEAVGPDIALIDLDLSPGCTLVASLHRDFPGTRIIVLGDRDADQTQLVDALAAGAVGAIHKEASLEELRRALTQSADASPVIAEAAAGLLLRSYVDSLTEKRQRDMATIEALAEAVELRDLATGRHQHRVTELARRCVERIDPGLALNEEVAFGFMLHDIGKIGVPDAILRKAGPLDDDEWDVMRRHPEMGVRIVEPIGFAPAATEIILSHHEHWDGSGYPRRLKGEEIPVAARAFAVADAYDAMTTDRPYRGAMAKDDALEVIQTAAGRDFDPEVVEVFIDLPE